MPRGSACCRNARGVTTSRVPTRRAQPPVEPRTGGNGAGTASSRRPVRPGACCSLCPRLSGGFSGAQAAPQVAPAASPRPIDEPLGIGSFRRSFKSACLAVGITPGRAGKTLHDFRRTGVANLIDSGCDERTAMLISGHKTASMLARYNIRRREAVRRALQQVGDYVAGMSAEMTITSRPSKPSV